MTLRAQAANPSQISASVGPCFKPAGWLRSAGVAMAISLAAAPLVVSAADLLRGDPVQEGFNAPGLARIDAFFKSEVESNRTPGAVLFIARNGKLVIQKAYGYLDKSAGVPMREDALFSIASMTKVMTVVAALTLTEEARLPLSAPVSNWFPEFKEARLGVVNAQGQVTPETPKRSLTVQDLMRHTTGLTYGARGNTRYTSCFLPHPQAQHRVIQGPNSWPRWRLRRYCMSRAPFGTTALALTPLDSSWKRKAVRLSTRSCVTESGADWA